MLLLGVLAGCVHGPIELSTAKQTLEALTAGQRVRVVIGYQRCGLKVEGKPEPAPDAIGGFEVGAFEYFARGVVHNERAYTALSETKTIVHPRYGAVQNYVRLRVYEDGEVELVAKYLRPPALEVVMDETFTCRLGDAVHFTTQP
jgi:VirK protein